MKLFSNLASFLLARLGQALHSLRASPRRAPVLVPIPIRAAQRARPASRRLPYRGG
jgi:hypothetical protein